MVSTKRKSDELGEDKPAGEEDCRKKSSTDARSLSSRPELPGEAWGNVLNFLPYHDVRKTLLVCRSVAFDAPKYVTHLRIHNAYELNVPAARRFPNVTHLTFRCVVSVSDKSLNAVAIGRVVPYMTAFPNLRSCSLCGIKSWAYNSYNIPGPSIYRSMLESLCGAFETKILSSSLQLHSFLPLYSTFTCTPACETDTAKCSFCRRIVRSFPLNAIIGIPGASRNMKSGKSQQFCIPHEEYLALYRDRNWTSECVRQHPNHLPIRLKWKRLATPFCEGDQSYDSVCYLPRESITQFQLMKDLGYDARNWRAIQLTRLGKDKKKKLPLLDLTFNHLVELGLNMPRDNIVIVPASARPELESLSALYNQLE